MGLTVRFTYLPLPTVGSMHRSSRRSLTLGLALKGDYIREMFLQGGLSIANGVAGEGVRVVHGGAKSAKLQRTLVLELGSSHDGWNFGGI